MLKDRRGRPHCSSCCQCSPGLKNLPLQGSLLLAQSSIRCASILLAKEPKSSGGALGNGAKDALQMSFQLGGHLGAQSQPGKR